MNYKITEKYGAEALFEVGVDSKGNHFLVIFGKHINGYFCCIPNWGFGCEMAEPEDIEYNAEKLEQRFHPELSRALATAIRNAAESEKKTS